MKITWGLFLILSFSSLAFAEIKSLTYQQAIAESEQNSPDLKKFKAMAERMSWGKIEALSSYLPRISANYSHYFDSKYMRESIVFGGAAIDFPAAYPQDDINLEAELTVFDGFAGINRIKEASLHSQAAEADLRRAQLMLNASVRTAFFQALAAQKLLDVSHENIRTLEDHLERAKLTERAGYGTHFDVLRIESNLEEAKAEEQSAENDVYIARDLLTEAMGITQGDARPLAGELPVLADADVPADLGLDSMQRDDFQAQLKRGEAAGKSLAASRAFWYPSVSIFVNDEFYKFGTFDPVILPSSGFLNAWAVGLRLRWNLFDGGLSYARQEEAKQLEIEAQAETQKALARLPREFDSWKRKFHYSVALYKARLRALAESQESVRLAGIGVRTGSRTHTEMLDAESDLFRARGGVVRAQAQGIEALGKLELAVGHKLWNPATIGNSKN